MCSLVSNNKYIVVRLHGAIVPQYHSTSRPPPACRYGAARGGRPRGGGRDAGSATVCGGPGGGGRAGAVCSRRGGVRAATLQGCVCVCVSTGTLPPAPPAAPAPLPAWVRALLLPAVLVPALAALVVVLVGLAVVCVALARRHPRRLGGRLSTLLSFLSYCSTYNTHEQSRLSAIF